MMSNSAIPVQRYRRRLQFRSLDMSVCLPVHRPSLTHSIPHSFRGAAATVWWAIDKVEVDRDNYGALVFITDIGMDGRGPGNFRAEVLSRHASSLNIQQTTLTKWPDIAHIEDLLELASCTLFRDSIEHEHLAPKKEQYEVWKSVCQIRIEICGDGWTMVTPHDWDEREKIARLPNIHEM